MFNIKPTRADNVIFFVKWIHENSKEPKDYDPLPHNNGWVLEEGLLSELALDSE